MNSFYEDVGRMYGKTCKYVHLSKYQIEERMLLVNRGNIPGKESPAEIKEFNDFLINSLALSLVLILHSVDQYVAGDLLVERDGSSYDWVFARSKYIAYIDQSFDYKHERLMNLDKIKRERWERVYIAE